ADAAALHHDVPVVQVAVVLADFMDLLEAARERVQQVQALEQRQPLAWLPFQEVRELLALEQLGHEELHDVSAILDLVVRVVPDQDRALREPRELARMEADGPVTEVAVRVEELRRALDAGREFLQAI